MSKKTKITLMFCFLFWTRQKKSSLPHCQQIGDIIIRPVKVR